MSANKMSHAEQAGVDVKRKILDTACELFYKQGARAVGVDLVVAKAGVAKTSLYRYFGTKDDLVAAFVEREDLAFWETWDSVAAQHADSPRAELDGQLEWIGKRAGQADYRGCPHLNVVAEFPEVDHPARKLATAHKRELRRRLKALVTRLGVVDAEMLAGQIAVLINGAFVSTPIFESEEAVPLLRSAVEALITANTPSAKRTRAPLK